MWDLDVDMQRIGNLLGQDPLLAGLQARWPGSRIRTLRGVAQALASGKLTLTTASDDQLLALPGIGPWTVAYWRLRCGLDSDAFPASDLVLQKALGVCCKLPVKEVLAQSATWQPWRAYAASWLWHAMSKAPTLLTNTGSNEAQSGN